MTGHDQLIRAVHLATRKLASSGDVDLLMKDVLALCVESVGASGGTVYLHDPAARRLKFQYVLPEAISAKLPARDIADDYGMAGEAFQRRTTLRRVFPERPVDEWNTFERATGVPVRNMLCAPLMMADEMPIGVVALINKLDGTFEQNDADVMDTIGAVATMAYLNARLTDESTRASTLLGMGKVSHDIANLAASLYATLGFGEMLMDGLGKHLKKVKLDETSRMYVEGLEPLMSDLRQSVDRIVGYSTLISDLSAGRPLRPNKRLAPLAGTIHDAAAYLEAQGRAHHVAIRYELAEEAPPTCHDPVFLLRIVQNLVGNAIKAVIESMPEEWRLQNEGNEEAIFGEITVRYLYADGKHVIEVTDSGPGMPPETIARILSGTARSQWEQSGGSGWGTKIVLELAATHGGVVSIDSELGLGTTFRVAFPHDDALGESGA